MQRVLHARITRVHPIRRHSTKILLRKPDRLTVSRISYRSINHSNFRRSLHRAPNQDPHIRYIATASIGTRTFRKVRRFIHATKGMLLTRKTRSSQHDILSLNKNFNHRRIIRISIAHNSRFKHLLPQPNRPTTRRFDIRPPANRHRSHQTRHTEHRKSTQTAHASHRYKSEPLRPSKSNYPRS